MERLQKGENLLEARISYHSKVNIENMYLLGDFGVAVTGSRAMITAPVKELTFVVRDWLFTAETWFTGWKLKCLKRQTW